MLFTSIRNAIPALKNFTPFFDRVVVERLVPEVKTKGGIIIPEKSQGKVLEGTVISVGTGQRTEDGKTISPVVQVGDRVLLPEYGGSKITVEEKDFYIYRESDLIGKFN